MLARQARAANTAVVTGASSGIGAAYARRLAEQGFDLVLVARRRHRLEQLAAALTVQRGIHAELIVADLADPAGVKLVSDRVAADDVSILVNNAGINGYGPFDQVESSVLARVLTVNAMTPMLLTHSAVRGMRRRGMGTIVNVASLLAFSGSLPPDPLPHRATYAGSKAFLVTFTRTLALELTGTGVRLQVLCPARTATEFHLTSDGTSVPDDVQPMTSTGVAAMTAEDVVQASLSALSTGEIVVIPGLAHASAVHRLSEVEAELRAGRVPQLAPRYANVPSNANDPLSESGR